MFLRQVDAEFPLQPFAGSASFLIVTLF